MGEAGVIEDAAVERDVSTLPPRDTGTSDSTVEEDSGGGTCTKDVFINELKTEGPGANDEFVELYNPNNCSVPLGGWSVKYQSAGGGAGGAGHTFAVGDSIPARSFLVLAPPSFPGADADWTPGMAGAAGQIALFDDTNAKIDGVGYGNVTGGSYREGTSAPAPPSNGSIGRKVDGVDTDNNNADFRTYTTPSPGASNP
ncbi:MAG: lamin tail domain-containing protein [Labilithrix sp.]|nr:lamin tail domain-containing protein [Labilithrix sp.]